MQSSSCCSRARTATKAKKTTSIADFPSPRNQASQQLFKQSSKQSSIQSSTPLAPACRRLLSRPLRALPPSQPPVALPTTTVTTITVVAASPPRQQTIESHFIFLNVCVACLRFVHLRVVSVLAICGRCVFPVRAHRRVFSTCRVVCRPAQQLKNSNFAGRVCRSESESSSDQGLFWHPNHYIIT